MSQLEKNHKTQLKNLEIKQGSIFFLFLSKDNKTREILNVSMVCVFILWIKVRKLYAFLLLYSLSFK